MGLVNELTVLFKELELMGEKEPEKSHTNYIKECILKKTGYKLDEHAIAELWKCYKMRRV